MNETTLKNRIGIILILGHFGILLLVLLFGMTGNFLIKEQMMTAIAIIAPFFASYTTAIIAYLVKTRGQLTPDGNIVSNIFRFVGFLLPSLFIAMVALEVILSAMKLGALADFENFKLILGATETVFGIYVGQLIFSMFQRVTQQVDGH